MGSSKVKETEVLAIQNTLSMTASERIELLANLVVEKIIQDQHDGNPLLKKIMGGQSD